MAEEHTGGNPWSDLWFVVGCLGLLIVVWLVRGGMNGLSADGLLLHSPVDSFTQATNRILGMPNAGVSGSKSSSAYDFSNIPPAPQLAGLARSAQSGEVTISDYSGAQSSDPQQEYIVLYASPTNANPVVISGWTLKSPITGRSAVIPGGVAVAHITSVMSTGLIALLPGQSAVISAGRSPIGVSFRENECTGYLSQFQQFTPPLTQACPISQNGLSLNTNPQLAQDASCVAAVESVAPCQTLLSTPTGISAACYDFISQRFTYNGCVSAHQNDSNFEQDEWRIYLEQSAPLWNSQSDIIALLDVHGALVSAVTY